MNRHDIGLTGADDLILRQLTDREIGNGIRFGRDVSAAISRLEAIGYAATTQCSGITLAVATKAGRDAIAMLDNPLDHRSDTVDALTQAESFISGFEDDETQEGVADILAGLRAAIVREQARPVLLDALKELRSAAIGYRDAATRNHGFRVSNETTNMLSAWLLNADKAIVSAEGR